MGKRRLSTPASESLTTTARKKHKRYELLVATAKGIPVNRLSSSDRANFHQLN